jgi:hypothetical protein
MGGSSFVKVQFRVHLVWCFRSSLNNPNVIPGKLAIAGATWNPGLRRTAGFPLQPKADPSSGGCAGMTTLGHRFGKRTLVPGH